MRMPKDYKKLDLPPISDEEIKRIQAIKDEEIDLSDMPEITDEQ